MEPNKDLASYKKRQSIIEIVGTGGLEKYADLNMIEAYAKAFGMDPDYVEANVSFDTMMAFHIKWKQEHEHREKFEEIERMMTESKQA